MKFKKGVSLAGAREEIRPILIAADRIWKDFGQELVITCYMNGMHSPGSHHYYGYALDLRTRYFRDYDEVVSVARELGFALGHNHGDRYKVIVEKTHIHVHFRRWE
jgi:hypothetical protein